MDRGLGHGRAGVGRRREGRALLPTVRQRHLDLGLVEIDVFRPQAMNMTSNTNKHKTTLYIYTYLYIYMIIYAIASRNK